MIKCVAIDDEPIALSIIQEYCKRFGGVELQCFTSPIEGMACVTETRPDIVFLDIEMNSHNGVELAKEMPPETCIIFTTAYSQYALDGFNVDAVDFLHKPVFYPRFEHAIKKAMVLLDARGVPTRRRDTITLIRPSWLTLTTFLMWKQWTIMLRCSEADKVQSSRRLR